MEDFLEAVPLDVQAAVRPYQGVRRDAAKPRLPIGANVGMNPRLDAEGLAGGGVQLLTIGHRLFYLIAQRHRYWGRGCQWVGLIAKDQNPTGDRAGQLRVVQPLRSASIPTAWQMRISAG
jgi:hypothetical protein